MSVETKTGDGQERLQYRRRDLATAPKTWVMLFVIVVGVHLMVAEPGMFPGWDESVFFSQSGDIVGVDSDPSYFAPSREPGTPLLIGLLRGAGLNLESIRLGFMLVFLSVSGLGFYLLAPTLRWGAVAGFFVFAGHWISLAFSWRFFGVPIASAFFVLSAGLGVRLLFESNHGRRWWWSLALGFSSAGMLSMRHLEAWIAVSVLWLVLLGVAVRRREGLVRFILAAGLLSLVAFVGIELFRVMNYHESVSDWFEALSAQLSGSPESSETLLTRFLKLLGSLAGGYHLWFQEQIPTGSVVFTAVAAGLTLLVVLLRGRDGEKGNVGTSFETASPPVLWWLGTALILLYLALFVVAGFPASPRDRYLMWFVAGGAILVGLVLRGAYPALQSVLLGIAAVVFLVGSYQAANFDTTTFTESGEGLRQLGLTMHVLAQGEDCVAASRYGAPAIQLASGCSVRSLSDPDEARAWLEDAPADSTRFLTFPAAGQLEDIPGWTSRTSDDSSMDLWFRDGS